MNETCDRCGPAVQRLTAWTGPADVVALWAVRPRNHENPGAA
jgi:hypothetical protein